MSFEKLLTSSAGIEHSWMEDAQGNVIFRQQQDVAPILEHAKAQARHNNGYTADKSLRRCATIPASIRLKWLSEEGWDCFSPDPECQRRLCQKLDSSEWAHLRTAEFRLGDHWRKHI